MTSTTSPPRRSLIPFTTGDQVIEMIRAGDGGTGGPPVEATRRLVFITEHGADHCVTQTGHVYTRRGTSIPRDDEPYRSITSPDYAQDWQPHDLTTPVSPPVGVTTSPRRQDGDAPGATDGHDAGQT